MERIHGEIYLVSETQLKFLLLFLLSFFKALNQSLNLNGSLNSSLNMAQLSKTVPQLPSSSLDKNRLPKIPGLITSK